MLQLWDSMPSFDEREAARRSSYAADRELSDGKTNAEKARPDLSVGVTESVTTDKSTSVLAPSGDDAAFAMPPGSTPSSASAGSCGDPDDRAVNIYEPILLYCKADAQASCWLVQVVVGVDVVGGGGGGATSRGVDNSGMKILNL